MYRTEFPMRCDLELHTPTMSHGHSMLNSQWEVEAAYVESATTCDPRQNCLCDKGKGISSKERAKHTILSLRLRKPYLVYCFVCLAVILFLLTWNIAKGVWYEWDLPQWEHHRWEEVVEAIIGVCMVIETLVTLRLMGTDFFRNLWCLFDFAVMLLFIVSTIYAFQNIRSEENITEANIALLMVRFVLQPVRVLAAIGTTYRTWQMQKVDELQVDFSLLHPSRESAQGLRLRTSFADHSFAVV